MSRTGGTARSTSRPARRARGRAWKGARGTPAGTWRACSSSWIRPRSRPRPCRIRLPRGEYIIVRGAWDRTLTDDELARASGRQVDPADPGAVRHRAGRVVVLSRNLARAGRGRDHDPAGPRGARRDRLAPQGGTDAGHLHPDVPRILRAPGFLRPLDPRHHRRARARAPWIDLELAACLRAVHAVVVGHHARRRIFAAPSGVAAVLPPRQPARLRAARARLPGPRVDLRAVRGRDDPRVAARQLAAGLRRLLPDVQAGGAVVARLRDLGG